MTSAIHDIYVLSPPIPGDDVLLIREIMHCKPGKVRPMVDKFLAMSKLNEKVGLGKMRVMTDFCGELYWTIVSEFEVPSMQAFEEMMKGEGMTPEMEMEFGKIMDGYHDLVENGRREIFKIEG
jgi:hypothetical protein